MYIDFTRIAASNTANYDVTISVKHRIFNTNLQYSCVHFVLKFDGKSSLTNGFYTI